MRFVIVVVCSTLINLGSIQMAVAQPSPSQRELRQMAYKFGTCVVKHQAARASKAVLENSDNLTLKLHYSRLFDGECLDRRGALAFPESFYLYTLADALVARELTNAPAPNVSKVPPLEHSSAAPFSDLKRKFGYDVALRATNDAEAARPINEFGECVVRESPANAKALLMTEPGSAAESARFEALQAALSVCAQEKTMELSKILLRGTIALNYYRLAQALLHIPVH
jgi:hypothetical protein